MYDNALGTTATHTYYWLTSAGARPQLIHDFTKSSITNNFLNINSIIIILIFLNSYKLTY